jgi:hypothetical protein
MLIFERNVNNIWNLKTWRVMTNLHVANPALEGNGCYSWAGTCNSICPQMTQLKSECISVLVMNELFLKPSTNSERYFFFEDVHWWDAVSNSTCACQMARINHSQQTCGISLCFLSPEKL